MQLITQITNNPIQTMKLVLDTKELVQFNLRFMPTQMSWYCDVIYNDVEIYGLKVALFPNLLRHFKNMLPFGIGFSANDHVEPFSVEDFANGRVQMFVLNKQEVEEIESVVFNEQ